MWSVLIGIAILVVAGGLVLWLIWPARIGAVAAGDRGNDGLIPSSGSPSGGGYGGTPGDWATRYWRSTSSLVRRRLFRAAPSGARSARPR